MSDANEIFKTCIEKEKTLSTLRENPKVNGAEISANLNSIRYDYRRILLEFPQFSLQQNKDVHGMLWKQGFYKQIEEFRRSIQKTMQVVEGGTDSGIIMQEKAKIHLLRLSSAMYKFLTDSATFYQDFLIQLESQYKLSESKVEVLRSMYRCLLYLGDLARYKELYSENKQKEYSEAAKYYKRAAVLMPSAGNPQNQLAVLAIYIKADLDAVYHYCRSILVDQPFTAAYDNLTILFDKSSKSITQNNIKADAPAEGMTHFIKKFIKLYALLFEFTKQTLQSKLQINSIKSDLKKLHNQLTESTDVERKSKILTEITALVQRRQKSLVLPQFNVYFFEELAQFVFQDLETIFTTPCVNDRFLKMLLVICLFTVHNAATSCKILSNSSVSQQCTHTLTSINFDPKNQQQRSSSEEYNEYIHKVLLTKPDSGFVAGCIQPHSHSVPESLSLTMLFNFITRIASKIDALGQSSDNTKKSLQNKLFPVLSLFSEWARHFNGYLVPTSSMQSSTIRDIIFSFDDNDGLYNDGNICFIEKVFEENIIREADLKAALICSPDMILNENRARLSMKSSVMNLKHMVEKSYRRTDKISESKTVSVTVSVDSPPPLREHIELRGFLPLAVPCEMYFAGKDPVYYIPPMAAEDAARDRRLKTIHLFLCDFLMPSVSNTTSPDRNRQRNMRGDESSAVNRDSNDHVRSREKPKGKLVDVGSSSSNRQASPRTGAKRREKRRESSGTQSKESSQASQNRTTTAKADRQNRMKKGTSVFEQSETVEYPPLPSNQQPQRSQTSLESSSQADKEGVYAKFASSRLFSGVQPPADLKPFSEQSDDEDEQEEEEDEEEGDDEDDDESYDYNFDERLEGDDDDDEEEQDQQPEQQGLIPEKRIHTFSDYLSSTSSSSSSTAAAAAAVEPTGYGQFNIGSSLFQFPPVLDGISAPALIASNDPLMFPGSTSSSLPVGIRNDAFQFSKDEDIDDDVVIFRPAFARPLNQSAAISRTPSESPLVRDTSPYGNLMTGAGSFTGWESSSLLHSNNTANLNNDNWFGNTVMKSSNTSATTTIPWWSESKVNDIPFPVPLNHTQFQQQQQQQQDEMLVDDDHSLAPPPGFSPPGFKAQTPPSQQQYPQQQGSTFFQNLQLQEK